MVVRQACCLLGRYRFSSVEPRTTNPFALASTDLATVTGLAGVRAPFPRSRNLCSYHIDSLECGGEFATSAYYLEKRLALHLNMMHECTIDLRRCRDKSHFGHSGFFSSF